MAKTKVKVEINSEMVRVDWPLDEAIAIEHALFAGDLKDVEFLAIDNACRRLRNAIDRTRRMVAESEKDARPSP